MPYQNKLFRRRAVQVLRDRRRTEGKCVQCGSPVDINPETEQPYWLCGPEQNNCRGANTASKARNYQRKKEEEVAASAQAGDRLDPET